MPIAKVQLSDGRIARFEVPDGTTQDQVMAEARKLESNQMPASAPPPPKGFLDRTIPGLIDRGGRMAESVARTGQLIPFTGENKQSLPETAFQVGGEALLGAGDILGNLAISGFRALPDAVENPIRQGAGAVLGALGKLPAGFGGEGTLGEAIPQEIGQVAQGFDQLDPRTQANIRALGAVATAYPPSKAVGKAGDVVGTGARVTGKGMQQTAKQIRKIIPEPKKISGKVLAKESGKYYDLADSFGGIATPSATSRIGTRIRHTVQASDIDLDPAVREARRKVTDPENKIRQVLDIFDEQAGKPLTLKGFEVLDKDLTGLAFGKSTDENVRRLILDIRAEFRKSMDDITDADMIGGKAGYEAYKQGRDLARKKFKIQDIEEIIWKSKSKAQPQNYIKKKLTDYVNDPDNLKYMSEAEIKALNKAAASGVISDISGMLSGRLLSTILTGSGSPAVGIAMRAGSEAMRGARGRVLGSNLDEVMRIMAGEPQLGALGMLKQSPAAGLDLTGNMLEKIYGPRAGRLGTLGAMQEKLEEQRQ